jgi:hypothetical protein
MTLASHPIRLFTATCFVALSATIARAEAPLPQLGTYGKVLLDEKFESLELPPNWNRNTGALRVEAGALVASERAADKHVGAFRYPLPLQDCAVQVDFRFDAGSKLLNLGFDPAGGELKKQGHLFSVVVTPQSWSLIEHPDKSAPQSKNKVLATAKTTFEAGKWHTLLLENKGDEVIVQVVGKEPLKGTSPDFHVKKPGLVFRMSGPDDEAVRFDNIRVWELK